MSRKKKEEAKKRRREAKLVRKSANYLRHGPKVGHTGRRQKKAKDKQFKPGPAKWDKTPYPHSFTKGSDKRFRPPGSAGRKKYPKLPLRPLRKRRHLSSSPTDHGHI